MSQKKIARKLLLVKWFDTYSDDRWKHIDYAIDWGGDRLIIQSVGWLIDETDKHILLAGGISELDDVHLLIHIPKSNIIQKIKINLHK